MCAITTRGQQLLASAAGETVKIWEPMTGRERALLGGQKNVATALCVVTVEGRELLASAKI